MESYLPISFLNDFIFCPKSIYYHNLYGKYNKAVYQDKPQVVGTLNHERIDSKTYSTQKKYLQGLEVFSEKYQLCGKIDVYDAESKSLIERKTKIKTIYDGYRYQLYAQYFCMVEMGYTVEHLYLHSLEDNKRYSVAIPDVSETKIFEALLQAITAFDVFAPGFSQNPQKCERCIYNNLCDSYLA